MAVDSSPPVLIVCDPELGSLRIAAVSLLGRLLVAAQRAGAGPITVICRGHFPEVPRARALGVEWDTARTPQVKGPTLLIEASALAQAGDLQRLIAHGGRLATSSKTPLPIGMAEEWRGSVAESLKGRRRLVAEGAAVAVCDRLSAAVAEAALWDTMGSSTDGLVDRYFNRPVGRLFSRLLIHTPVSPNVVSVIATLIGLSSCWFFAQGGHYHMILGALMLQFSAVIDCVDGDLARVLFKESESGKWIDLGGDQVVHVGLFTSLAMGLHRMDSPAPELWLGLSAVVGVAMAFVMVLRGMLRPEHRSNRRLQTLIDRTTNRDFSVLVLLLAIVNRLDIFLWLTAIGVHIFWLIAWRLQQTQAAVKEA
ncbi:MAG: CDP-alcohol phosphatidyltransferase family protein [Verrucomicrobiota bacterium]|nr:CDP-alcohol phosphatidyltransferase family protein [Verrucomicrobiota bacterium]